MAAVSLSAINGGYIIRSSESFCPSPSLIRPVTVTISNKEIQARIGDSFPDTKWPVKGALNTKRSSLSLGIEAEKTNDDGNCDYNNDDDEIEDLELESALTPPPITALDNDNIFPCTRQEMEEFTVAQLRQQLRLRGKKVGGKKNELIDRILGLENEVNTMSDATNSGPPTSPRDSSSSSTSDVAEEMSKARAFAKSKGKELIDVTEYLEDADKGKDFKETLIGDNASAQEEQEKESNEPSSNPETWGDEARIVEDYEGRSMVVDSLSRTVVQFKGADKDLVDAYVVATRDSLKGYLAGGDRAKNSKNSTIPTIPPNSERISEMTTFNIQKNKERASKVPMRIQDEHGEDKDDEEGYYKNILDRDYGDWGKISTTGAQVSSTEVQGILLLSDVNGPFTEKTKALADKIAFECQPVVVFVPDMFRGLPWKQDETKPGRVDEEGRTYDEWRDMHSDQRVSVDIRAAAAALRNQYAVSSISLFGTCYGGGRALEATARVYPNDTMDCESGMVGPPHVNPMAVVAWYPTKYDPKLLFGSKRKVEARTEGDSDDDAITKTSIMAIFAGEDNIPGATSDDAATLKACLEEDDRVKDYMVKIFPGEEHGFAHNTIGKEQEEVDEFFEEEFGGVPSNSMDGSNAEVAYLLSTAWIETYSRVFLPTIGPNVADDETWSKLDMHDLSFSNDRDVRQEIEEALKNTEDVVPDFRRMQPDDFNNPMDDIESMDDDLLDEEFMEKVKPYGISSEDDINTVIEKMKEAIDRDDFSFLPGIGEIPLDESGEAYW